MYRRKRQEADEGSNIRVVTRCRGRNDRETKANSAVIVDTNSESRTEVSVRVGSADMASSKTYTLDRVFGPEADQSMIFDEVVSPVVDDLLDGMNCTVFAYGQTGTGKTYTMSGDDSISDDSYAHEAGIIPRVLYKLFNCLERKDCAVTCSFMELYNEELRDLLDESGDGKKVRIFDDSAKKSVTIQGLSDCYITSAKNGLKVLQSGLSKRHVAATRINDFSSRSHTIFTLSVAIEHGNGDCTRGKINLVDLAGSENVGKSGAENKRAREAGLINQSLLALGRVINSLVDKSPHVPYRESKLTRLLQDSLGGRTKTCIIATISPAQVNIEETLSTLEYASRAKNVKNKPQVNSTVAKKTLLKDYAAEMERMRQDLVATRKKNGIYMDQENYNEMIADTETQKILVNDQQRKLDTIDSQLKAARELVENTRQQLKKVNIELETTSQDLTKTMSNLTNTETQLRNTRRALKNETSMRKAHANTESQLQSMGRDLLDTLDQTIDDVNTLVDKVQQKYEMEQRAHQVISTASGNITSSVGTVYQQLQSYSGEHSQLFNNLHERLTGLVNDEVSKIESVSDHVMTSLSNLDSMTSNLKSATADAESNANNMFSNVDQVREDIKSKVRQGLNTLSTSATGICQQIQQELDKFEHDIQSPVDHIVKLVKDAMVSQQGHYERKIGDLEELQRLMAQSAEESQKSHMQNRQVLEQEMKQAANKREALLAQMSQLMQECADSESRIAAQVAQQDYHQEISQYVDKTKAIVKYEQDGQTKYQAQQNEIASKLNGISTVIDQQKHQLTGVTDQFKQHAERAIDQQVAAVDHNIQSLDRFVETFGAQNKQHGQQISGQVTAVCENFQQVLETMTESLADMKQHLSTASTWQDTVATDSWNEVESTSLKSLDQIRLAANSLAQMQTQGPSGSTPKKRKMSFPTVLPRTDERSPLNDISQSENENKPVVVEDEKVSEKKLSTEKRSAMPVSTIPRKRLRR